MNYIQGDNREQIGFGSLEDSIAADNAVRIIEAFVFPRAKKGGASGRFTFPADKLHAGDSL